MAALISPGTSVTITNEAFIIPVTAPTVPLFFLATQANKLQPDGLSVAAGTTENSVIRQVTSMKQSLSLYGLPQFRVAPGDETLPVGQRRQQHGDARNEYGLFALNQFLNVASRAYVVRADVDLADQGVSVLQDQPPIFIGVGDGNLVDSAGASGIDLTQGVAVEEVWTLTCTVVGNVNNIPPTEFSVVGSISGPQGTAYVDQLYTNGIVSFTVSSQLALTGVAGVAYAVGDRYTVSIVQTVLPGILGATDADRRLSITSAIAAEINSNTEVRSELFEYNIIMCPGYHELADEMLALSIDIGEEAFVICDTPMDMTPSQVSTWSMTSARKRGTGIAYYYPHSLASNMDGANVVAAASGTALKTFAYSDSVSELWFAPAGAQRGLVTGIDKVGYVSGTLGGVTTFVETNLNQGQRDSLYEYDKNVNPIVFFPGRGLLVWGQKTSSPTAGALDRINVVRLTMYIKRSLRKGSFPFLFEINDTLTRDNLKAMVDGFLGDVLSKRGLYDYASICDTSNNTPARIDSNELWCDIAIKPSKVAEFIHIPVRVVSTGASI